MYAGTTIRHGSGKFVGVHQKINRVARRKLKSFLPTGVPFPTIKEILHFEGNNGPDGIKRKGPGTEPMHFIDLNDPDDRDLIDTINNHLANLTIALQHNDSVRASFEAAWSAHAIIDGLTPAHHYPMEEKIEELWGKSPEERNSILAKNLIVGEGIVDTLQKNWEYWGAGGVLTSHAIFEFGVASAMSTATFRGLHISRKDITRLKEDGFEAIYMESLESINSLKMYELVLSGGWNNRLAKMTREILAPEMIKIVMLAWYEAAAKASEK